MPGKIRTMGAGLGGSTSRNVNVNANTGGGNKKQGLSTTTNKRVQFVSNAIKARSYGENRNVVFCMNQLGGIGAVSGGNGSRMFGTTSDGVKDCITGPYGCEQVVREAYLEAYGREPDKSGLRTYCIAMTKRRWSKADIVADLKKNEDSLAPIYASLEGNYLMSIWDLVSEEQLVEGQKVHIDNQGNITVNPTIGKITVNSETEYSLTMGISGVENVVGGPNNKNIIPARSYGNMPRINACELYFSNDSVDVAFFKDTDGDGVVDSNDPFPENENKSVVTQPPVITLNGDNPLTVELGSVYEDPGATATDELGDSISNPDFNTDNGAEDLSSIDVSGSVDTNTVGSYTITYTAYDNWDLSSTATRTVNVVDTTAPVITLNGDEEITIEVDVNGNYEDEGATATDNDGVTPITGVTDGVDITQVGVYYVVFEAEDGSGNISSKTRTVNVVDTTSPVITLLGNNPYTAYLGSSAALIPGATATDASSENNLTVTVTGTVDTNTLGTYTLTYTAEDESNNSALVTRTVNVEEQTHIYSFQNLYNALKSNNGVDGRLIQVDTDGEFDDAKILTKGPGVFAELSQQGSTGYKAWNSKTWFPGSNSAWHVELYGRGDQQEVSVPGIMLLDPDSISSSSELPLDVDSLDINDSSKLIGLSIIQLVSGGFINNGISGFYLNETDPMFRYVWRTPPGTPSFFYKLYLRYSPSEQAGTSGVDDKEDYQIMKNDFTDYEQIGVAKPDAKFSNLSLYDGEDDGVVVGGDVGGNAISRAGIAPNTQCNCFSLNNGLENIDQYNRGTRGSDNLFGDDCNKVGWTEGQQYGTTIKVWVEIVDENGDPVQDDSYESLMA